MNSNQFVGTTDSADHHSGALEVRRTAKAGGKGVYPFKYTATQAFSLVYIKNF